MITRIQNWLERQLRWKGLAWIFAILATTCSGLIMHLNISLLEALDQKAKDFIVRSRPAVDPSPAVAVVAVDEKSIKQYGRWPWKRALQAQLLKELRQHYHAGILGLDIIYLQPEDELNDHELEMALDPVGSPVVGGYFFRDQQTVGGDHEAQTILQQNQLSLTHTLDATEPTAVLSFPFVETNQNRFSPLMAGLGFFNTVHDVDGLIRSTPLVASYEQGYYPSLALKTLATYCNLQISAVFAKQGVANLRLTPTDSMQASAPDRCEALWQQRKPPLDIPVSTKGALWLDFYRGQGIPIYSAADVLAHRLELDSLQDKIIFIGVTEIGIADLRPTPIDDSFPGVAVHATVVSNILLNHHYDEGTEDIAFINGLMILLLPLLIVWVMSRVQRALLMILSFMGLLFVVGLLFRLLISQQLLISVIYPLVAVGITFVLVQTYFILTTQRHARFLRGAFASYVSPDLVSLLVKNPETLNLKGENRNISVLFSDIRGFTTLSESLTPETLVALLNAYLGPMTDIVMAQRGTLDKYIGDAVMALYNAPIEVSDHPQRATRSALQMIVRLSELNTQFQQEFKVSLHIGIGIHSGPAIVGNMGSATRFNYTAMGDTVNLASRIEGRTKAYGVQLIITEETQQRLGHGFFCRRLDKIRVKGKHIPVTIFEVLTEGTPSPEQQDLVRRFETGLNYYFNGDFFSGQEQFKRVLQQYPQDGPSQVFLQRCTEFLAHPPGAGEWDGVYTATDK